MSRELAEIEISLIDDYEFAVRASLAGDAFDELVGSIRRDGVLQPILLIRRGDRYAIAAGHRRCAAALSAGLLTIPAQIVSDAEGMGWRGSFAENMFRQDLSPLEEAAAIKDCLEGGEYDIDGVARFTSRSRTWVDGRLELLTWPDDCQQVVHTGALSVSAVRHLAGISDVTHRVMLIEYAIANGASARTCAAWRQAWDVGAAVTEPATLEREGSQVAAVPIEPYTPCVLCGRQCKMTELSFSPVCTECGPTLLEVARQLRSGDVAEGG